MLELKEVLKQGNSPTNQKIKGQFIARDVLCNVNELVEFCLNKSYESSDTPHSWDDVVNLYKPKEDQYRYNMEQDEDGNDYIRIETPDDEEYMIIDGKEYKKLCKDEFTDNPDYCDVERWVNDTNRLGYKIDLLDTDDEWETEPQEIFEWWAVSGYLCDKLEKLGEPVLYDGYHHYWGRCTTGQAILLDYVITRICADMEILEGQANDWSKQG